MQHERRAFSDSLYISLSNHSLLHNASMSQQQQSISHSNSQHNSSLYIALSAASTMQRALEDELDIEAILNDHNLDAANIAADPDVRNGSVFILEHFEQLLLARGGGGGLDDEGHSHYRQAQGGAGPHPRQPQGHLPARRHTFALPRGSGLAPNTDIYADDDDEDAAASQLPELTDDMDDEERQRVEYLARRRGLRQMKRHIKRQIDAQLPGEIGKALSALCNEQHQFKEHCDASVERKLARGEDLGSLDALLAGNAAAFSALQGAIKFNEAMRMLLGHLHDGVLFDGPEISGVQQMRLMQQIYDAMLRSNRASFVLALHKFETVQGFDHCKDVDDDEAAHSVLDVNMGTVAVSQLSRPARDELKSVFGQRQEAVLAEMVESVEMNREMAVNNWRIIYCSSTTWWTATI